MPPDKPTNREDPDRRTGSSAPKRSGGGRKRGAPRGNKNALKHGIYSEYITPAENSEIEAMSPDRNQSELALARVRLRNCLRKQAEASPDVWIEYERVIIHYVRIITSLTHNNAILRADNHSAYVTVMELIREVNDEQGVQ